eukprot:12485735-Ditylum_brightwellii.AAC.1
MIDPKSLELPDYDNILATYKKEIEKKLHDQIEEDFPVLLKHQLEYGHVPDEVFEKVGYPLDVDAYGKEVRRDSTIPQETFQRAKCSSHVYQCNLREELTANILTTKEEKSKKMEPKHLE